MFKSLLKQKDIQTSEFTVTLRKAEDNGFGFLVKKNFSKPYMIISKLLKGKREFVDKLNFNFTTIFCCFPL